MKGQINKNRIAKASNQNVNRAKAEQLEINMLLTHINERAYSEINKWVRTKLFSRLDELEIITASKSHTPWKTSEIKWLRDNYPKTSARELAIDLKRSKATVQKMIWKLKIDKNPTN